MSLSYLILSLPESSSFDSDSLKTNLQTTICPSTYKLTLPEFKIGTLDSLVQQSEELGKLDSQITQSLGKVLDIMSQMFDQDQNKINKLKNINEQKVPDYVESFQWNTSKYRLDRSIQQLIQLISNDSGILDSEVKNLFTNYNVAKTNLVNSQKRQTGDLTIKSLHNLVKRSHFVLDSDHLETVLVVVPKNAKKEFLEEYETLTQFVVPRSACEITTDEGYILYSVTLFKKYVAEFIANAREQKWTPREFNYSDELINDLEKEFETNQQQEKTLKNDLIRLVRTCYSDLAADLVHIKVLRAFVESVLRYGLPPNFYCFLLKMPEKAIKPAKKELYKQFGYLGGAAFGVDNKGKLVKESDQLHEFASLVDTDYEPFVLYDVEFH